MPASVFSSPRLASSPGNSLFLSNRGSVLPGSIAAAPDPAPPVYSPLTPVPLSSVVLLSTNTSSQHHCLAAQTAFLASSSVPSLPACPCRRTHDPAPTARITLAGPPLALALAPELVARFELKLDTIPTLTQVGEVPHQRSCNQCLSATTEQGSD